MLGNFENLFFLLGIIVAVVGGFKKKINLLIFSFIFYTIGWVLSTYDLILNPIKGNAFALGFLIAMIVIGFGSTIAMLIFAIKSKKKLSA